MKRVRVTIEQVRPEHGCARCIWWRRVRNTNWGRCLSDGDTTTWWQHGPCCEYERNGLAPENIRLLLEISNGKLKLSDEY